jgi:nucleoid DNA-binding protein
MPTRKPDKTVLVQSLSTRLKMDEAQVRRILDEIANIAESELKRSGEVVLPGIVKLVARRRKARAGRNPATGEAITIPERHVVIGRVAKRFAASLEGDEIPPPPPPKKRFTSGTG